MRSSLALPRQWLRYLLLFGSLGLLPPLAAQPAAQRSPTAGQLLLAGGQPLGPGPASG